MTSKHLSIDTICAEASPRGRGAISLIRISGTKLWEQINPIFPILKSKFSKLDHKKFYITELVFHEKIVDQIILTYYEAPNSYTGEDIIEISCHGNPIIVDKVIDILMTFRIRIAEKGEFTQRAVVNNKINLLQAEAIGDLIDAKNINIAEKALNNIKNKFSNIINNIKSNIHYILAEIEARIDFPEEDLGEKDNNLILNKLNNILVEIKSIIDNSKIINKWSKGYRVILVGKTNVGKSSLFNRLIDEERAIVSSKPGTTRDYIDASINLNGMEVSFTDTAGINAFSDNIEEIGKLKMLSLLEKSDLILWVIDSNSVFADEDLEVYENIKKMDSVIIIYNKCDLEKINHLPADINFNKIDLSAQTAYNIDVLKNLIIEKFSSLSNSISDITVSTNKRQTKKLEYSYEILYNIYNTSILSNTIMDELLADDLWKVSKILSELIGETDVDKIWDEIFETFCIGK